MDPFLFKSYVVSIDLFKPLFGGYSAEATPVSIPNTEVKLCCANDTAWETMWESRSPPNLYKKGTHICGSLFLLN